MCFANDSASTKNQQFIDPNQPTSFMVFNRQSDCIVLEYKYCTDNKVFNTASPRIEMTVTERYITGLSRNKRAYSRAYLITLYSV